MSDRDYAVRVAVGSMKFGIESIGVRGRDQEFVLEQTQSICVFDKEWKSLLVMEFPNFARVTFSEHGFVLFQNNNCLRDNSDGRPRYGFPKMFVNN